MKAPERARPHYSRVNTLGGSPKERALAGSFRRQAHSSLGSLGCSHLRNRLNGCALDESRLAARHSGIGLEPVRGRSSHRPRALLRGRLKPCKARCARGRHFCQAFDAGGCPSRLRLPCSTNISRTAPKINAFRRPSLARAALRNCQWSPVLLSMERWKRRAKQLPKNWNPPRRASSRSDSPTTNCAP
jgi:hypothetical protein